MLKAALDRYYEEVSQHTAAPADELQRMDRLLALGGNKTLDGISDSDVAVMVAKLRGTKARYKDTFLAPGTINRVLELARRVWRRARDLWGIDVGKEPAWGRHLLEEPDERVRELSVDEEERLFEHLRADFHPIVRFAMLSGIRFANCRALRWNQVDFQARSISLKVKSKKPGGAARTVPITQAMLVLLAEQRGHHPIYVFTYLCEKSANTKRQAGKRYPFSRDGWRKPWMAALTAAGVEDFRFHDTRHTAATRTLRASGNLKAVQKMLGHTEVATTAKYAHVLDEDVRRAMEAAQSRTIPEAATRQAGKTGEKVRRRKGVA